MIPTVPTVTQCWIRAIMELLGYWHLYCYIEITYSATTTTDMTIDNGGFFASFKNNVC